MGALAGKVELEAVIAREVAGLRARKAELEAVEATEASEAGLRARFDSTDRGKLLHRYEVNIERGLHRDIREAMAVNRWTMQMADLIGLAAKESRRKGTPGLRNEATAGASGRRRCRRRWSRATVSRRWTWRSRRGGTGSVGNSGWVGVISGGAGALFGGSGIGVARGGRMKHIAGGDDQGSAPARLSSRLVGGGGVFEGLHRVAGAALAEAADGGRVAEHLLERGAGLDDLELAAVHVLSIWARRLERSAMMLPR